MTIENNIEICFFCDEEGSRLNPLRKASTKNLDQNVRETATLLQDSRILTKLGHTDLIAQDAMYHLSCLTKYYRRAASYLLERKDDCNSSVDGTILAELVSHIEEARQEKETKVFKLLN